MVTYGWGIFIVFMVSILLLAAIGMLYLLRSLYPFSSKYEIACVIVCVIVMILAVLFSVYGVKKLVAPLSMEGVEWQRDGSNIRCTGSSVSTSGLRNIQRFQKRDSNERINKKGYLCG